MEKQKLSEAVLTKKILLLRQKYKQQKKEERVFMKRNKKLVNEIQSLKETSKSLNDERLELQKDIYNKKYAKAVSEGDNIRLKNSLSSFLNDLHALETIVINSWKDNQRERNKHSSKKPSGSCPQESVEEQTITEEPDNQSRSSSPLQDMPRSQGSVLVCKVENLNGHEVKPVLTSHCDLSENKEELSLLLSSFCRRDTVPLDKPSGSGCQGSGTVQLERTSEPEYLESENVTLVGTCEPDCQESESTPLEITCKPDIQESINLPLERTCLLDYQESGTAPLEETCTPNFQESPNVSVESTCELNHEEFEPDSLQSKNEVETTGPVEELFYGFVEDSNEKTKFTEMIGMLSEKCETLESLRNYEIAQSLTVFECNPEVTAKEAMVTSTLEENLSKYYKIQQLEVSIPRLDLSAYPSLNSTIEIPKKDLSRRRKSVTSSHSEDRNQRDKTPDSASESSNNGRSLRRARNAVSYKEKPLKTKLRRS